MDHATCLNLREAYIILFASNFLEIRQKFIFRILFGFECRLYFKLTVHETKNNEFYMFMNKLLFVYSYRIDMIAFNRQLIQG